MLEIENLTEVTNMIAISEALNPINDDDAEQNQEQLRPSTPPVDECSVCFESVSDICL